MVYTRNIPGIYHTMGISQYISFGIPGSWHAESALALLMNDQVHCQYRLTWQSPMSKLAGSLGQLCWKTRTVMMSAAFGCVGIAIPDYILNPGITPPAQGLLLAGMARCLVWENGGWYMPGIYRYIPPGVYGMVYTPAVIILILRSYYYRLGTSGVHL